MKTIVQDGDPVLRGTAAAVPEELFGSPKLQGIIRDMADALDQEPDGVALAAPQLGIPYRLFIVRRDRTLAPPPEGAPPHEAQVDVYINPEIIRSSRRRARVDEGCLSVRGMYGTTMRHERVTIRAQHENGTSFTRGGGGLLAQIFEHEIDHLNGILFIDHAENLVHISHAHEHTP